MNVCLVVIDQIQSLAQFGRWVAVAGESWSLQQIGVVSYGAMTDPFFVRLWLVPYSARTLARVTTLCVVGAWGLSDPGHHFLYTCELAIPQLPTYVSSCAARAA
jgi:hypothetical protein